MLSRPGLLLLGIRKYSGGIDDAEKQVMGKPLQPLSPRVSGELSESRAIDRGRIGALFDTARSWSGR